MQRVTQSDWLCQKAEISILFVINEGLDAKKFLQLEDFLFFSSYKNIERGLCFCHLSLM